MSGTRFAIIDPAAGISGDMLLGALIAAGAPREWLLELPARLGCPDVAVDIEDVDRAGVRATKVHVRLPSGAIEAPSEEYGHPANGRADHGDPHGRDHRRVGELIAAVERAPLSPWVRERAVRAFRLLGDAEGRVHGVRGDEVSLHELGALDALIDIVGGIEGFERLGVTEIYHRPVAVGTGWVRAAHGTISVPAPATGILLEDLEIAPNGPVVGEATTPTGAVLLRVLSRGAPPGRWRAVSAGAWGAGTRNPPGYANALRLFLADAAAEAGEVVVLVTDIDDLSPEYLEPLREALFTAGALDVQLWTTQMKKGRTAFRLEALAERTSADAVSQALFRHSTTSGLRRWTAERTTLARREVMVELPGAAAVRVKILDAPDGPRIKPEYDDVREAALRLGRPAHEVAREVGRLAERRVEDV